MKDKKGYQQELARLREILKKEVADQGETEEMILQGTLPTFYAQSYEIRQGNSAHPMSFKKDRWNPDTLFVTAYLNGLDQSGVLFKYFKQFKVIAENSKLGVVFNDGQTFYSDVLTDKKGHLVMRLTKQGDFELKLNGKPLVQGEVKTDPTKINGGYVSVGLARDETTPVGMPAYFKGDIQEMRFSMNYIDGGF